ncbi:ABC transporter permease [Arcanobacterium ihumii]|uniref:ABC transporter permease n=1 Tax=Arcanobacterium ihumii TaxID=2138162 RepID=UPI001357E159|nr:ABC transporter permease [Arcanobacterium ihumii]
MAEVPKFILPGPLDVGHEIGKIISSGELWPHFFYTARNVLSGFLLGMIFGGFLGYLCQKNPIVEAAISPFLVFLQATPKIALAPIFVLWFGFGLESQILLIFSLAFFPIMTGVMAGLASLDPQFIELGTLMKMNRWDFFRKIQGPAALPEFFTGMRIGLLDALTGAVLAEFISSDKGLGYLLVFGNSTYKTAILMSAILVIVLFGIAIYLFIQLVENRFLKWKIDKYDASHF